jgi:hypothetical protein
VKRSDDSWLAKRILAVGMIELRSDAGIDTLRPFAALQQHGSD